MTTRELERRLDALGVSDAKLEARLLAEHFCGVSKTVYPFFEGDLSSAELDAAITRRASGEPIQYILGKWCFMNEEYEVTPDVLIPRQDTEILVEWAINNLPHEASALDLCTGSGCIAISVAAAREDVTFDAVDISSAAIGVAKRNARRAEVADRVRFFETDVLTDFPEKRYDAIISNPPYVSEKEYGALEKELYFEPKAALTDGGDGLAFYRRILGAFGAALEDGGCIALEIGARQTESVCDIASQNGFYCEIIKDYSGNDRVAVCKKK
ncbi:MAG: peptide chain release factor N(5)-glutamine methyltransferase [Clostridia bacterium]|nr:peptide chain release factor N(5)-glutamine methyltransferase [Clostridia bacterium]